MRDLEHTLKICAVSLSYAYMFATEIAALLVRLACTKGGEDCVCFSHCLTCAGEAYVSAGVTTRQLRVTFGRLCVTLFR